jgi:hypothetical protein
VPELRNHKREIFARFLADGHSQSESYELAGYRPSTANASTLANRPEVVQRTKELRDEKMQREVELQTRLAALGVDTPEEALAEAQDEVIRWTCDRVRTELFKNARLAQSQNEYSAANKSLELIGKSLGMWDNEKPKDNGKQAPTPVSIAFINSATERLEDGSGAEPARPSNPLKPAVSSPR